MVVFATNLKLRADEPASRPAPAEEMVISASRIETPVSEVGSSISVVNSKQIERKQQPLVADAIRTVPGVDVVRTGGPGQQTNVFIRGAGAEQTLVLIDGVPANDPTTPTGAFDFSTLTLDNVDRVEVLRGPQSLFWGSGAMGGVVNVISGRGQQGPPHFFYTQEFGSYNTFHEAVGVSGATKVVNYSLTISRIDSDGISAADSGLGNVEADAFYVTTGAGKIGVNVSENFDIDFIFRAQNSVVNLDDNGGPRFQTDFFGNTIDIDTPNRRLFLEQEFARIQPRLTLFDGALEQVWGVSASHVRRRDNSPAYGATNTGHLVKLDLQNNLHIGDTNILSAGADYTDESFQSDSGGMFTTNVADAHQNDLGFFLQDQQKFFDRLTVTAGIRYDQTSSAGDATTCRLTAAYLLKETHTEFRGSYGTGFKVPTLFDRLDSFYGSPNLKPEESEGWDAGVEQYLYKDRLSVGGTYFHNRFKNLITSDPSNNFRAANINAAQTQGVEAFVAIRPIDTLTIRASYTYTEAMDLGTHTRLLRRPFNKVGLDATWDFIKNASLTLSTVYVDERTDIDPVTFGRTVVGGHTLVNLAAEYRFCPNFKLFGRVENLLSQDYQEVAGYGTPGLSGVIGFRLDI